MIKNILYIAIFSTILVGALIAFGIYHNQVTTTIEPDTQILITPIPPNFDQKVIDSLQTRQIIQADLGQARSISTPSGNTNNVQNINASTSATTQSSTNSAPLIQL